MYATIHRFRRWPDDESTEWARSLTAELSAGSSPAGVCVIGRLDGTDGAVFALWRTEEEASSAAGRRLEAGLDSHAYRVTDSHDGIAAGQEARFARLTWFDGDDRKRADARQRAGRERIWPAVQHVDGVVGAYVLRGDDDGTVVLGLSTSVQTPDAVVRAVFGTELLPWEDPADLTGPSRVEDGRVLFAQLPSAVRS
jgi:hypothetical protein